MKNKRGLEQLPGWLIGVIIVIVVFVLVLVWFTSVKTGGEGLLDRISNLFSLLILISPGLFSRIKNSKKAAVGLVPRQVLIIVLLLIGAAIIILFATGTLDRAFDAAQELFSLAPG